MIFLTGLQVYPGEQFTMSAAVVGEDFGITTGMSMPTYIILSAETRM